MGVVQLGVVQLGVVQLGIVQMGVDPRLAKEAAHGMGAGLDPRYILGAGWTFKLAAGDWC